MQEYQRPSFERHAVEGGRLACPCTGVVLQRHERFLAWSPHSFRSVTIVAMLACGGVVTEECAAVEGARRRSLWSHGYRHKGSDRGAQASADEIWLIGRKLAFAH